MSSDIKFYVSLLKKRLPVMTVIFLLSMAVGLSLAMTLPPRFEANARLMVESAKISDSGDGFSESSAANRQLRAIEERLMTRANMIDVANKFRVFGDNADISPDEMNDLMEASTSIRVIPGGRDSTTMMRISFETDNPNTAADVVNEFATIVENASATLRQNRVGETAAFFESEVRRLGEELSRKSAEIVAFKEANKGALPEELNYRLDRQSQVQERLNASAQNLASQIDQRSRLLALGRVSGAPSVQLTPEELRLSELRNQLASDLSVYSETSPRVKILRAQIESLQASMSPPGASGASADPMRNMLDVQIAEIDSRIANLEEDIRRGEKELLDLREAIEKTPQNSIRIEAMTRDYDNIQSQYNSNVASLAKAKADESIVLAGKDEQVRVIERAVAPSSPSSPNRKLIAGGGVFAGTALAAIFFVLTELINRSIRRPTDLVRGLGVQPLATIPYLESEKVHRRRRSLLVVGFIVSLIAIAAALWAVHTFYLPLDLFAERALKNIGL